MFKQSKEPEKKGSEKREYLLVSFLKDAHFVFAIILVRQIVTDNISDIGVLGSLVGDSYMAEVSMHTPGHIVFATAR